MKLYSTKNRNHIVSFKEAVFKGLPPDNGLYMPVHIPTLHNDFFQNIDKLTFQEIAHAVSEKLIGEDIPSADLKRIINTVLTFDAPVMVLKNNMHVLELFHGPSLAFKDFGARFMAGIMSYFLQHDQKHIMILVATSGDTGSAVAQGFYNMPGIRVTILYPSGKVSEIQEKQLTTLGNNVTALEVKGNFDDCQRMVKEAFLDEELNHAMLLTSANSINISRLIPQSFYYFYAYAQTKKYGKPVVFSTPSGNFGNLCAGLMAKRMGLPVHKFVASTNVNDVVPTYLRTGIFSPRPSIPTISNAMDVGNPSNFVRMVELYENDLNALKKDIVGKSYSDNETMQAIKETYNTTGYVMCPHTAVAYLGLRDYMQEAREELCGILLSTAHSGKFFDIVESVIKAKIQLPLRLQETMQKPKQATLIGNTLADLKKILLSMATNH
ncbi:MAG: threonine synthase [Cytophagaceae bacterium]|nr:threonine synthase [Cytophagaceae bacterium]MDW8455391.1 threonine synthase [Cytophagaceae bacterium]